MWQQEFLWFFTIFHQEFRKNNAIAFEVLMVLAVAHLFGFYNPKQLADFLEVPHQQHQGPPTRVRAYRLRWFAQQPQRDRQQHGGVQGRVAGRHRQVTERDRLSVNDLRFHVELPEVRQHPIQPSRQAHCRR